VYRRQSDIKGTPLDTPVQIKFLRSGCRLFNLFHIPRVAHKNICSRSRHLLPGPLSCLLPSGKSPLPRFDGGTRRSQVDGYHADHPTHLQPAIGTVLERLVRDGLNDADPVRAHDALMADRLVLVNRHNSSVRDFEQLNQEIVDCRLCPRLVAWREEVAATKRASFATESYWGRPVPYFGDFNGDLLIVGLAPAAHGANRTGRMFTGDRSGDFLFAALWRAGLANQPTCSSAQDGLKLHRVLIAATAHCAPPANKPLPEEVSNCSRYLREVLEMPQWRSILCLGGIAWNHVHRVLGLKATPFGHSEVHQTKGLHIVGSYHPSQQNTFTGRLTPQMFDEAISIWALRHLSFEAVSKAPT
jgi:uracil-DNA glycosylase family 4